MKITFVLAGADLTGGNRVISIYADRLQRRGHHVTVVSRPHKPVTLKDKARSLLRGQAIPVNQSKHPSHFDSLTEIEHRRIGEYRAIGADDVPDGDVVIATWWETAEWVVAFPPSKGRKFYFLQHFETHGGQDADRVEATWRLPLRKITIAEWLVELGREKFGQTDIALVPNAVDLEQFNAEPRGKRPAPTVGMMYSVVTYKGCEIAIKAFELARKSRPDLKLVAFGAREPTRHMPLPQGTDFTLQPAQDQIKNIYSRCDVWLMTSRSEGFGLPILEAMACRTPVLATPTGAAPELLSQGGGYIVPFDNAEAIARRILGVVQMEPKDWKQLSNTAQTVAARHTWDDATNLFESALRG